MTISTTVTVQDDGDIQGIMDARAEDLLTRDSRKPKKVKVVAVDESGRELARHTYEA